MPEAKWRSTGVCGGIAIALTLLLAAGGVRADAAYLTSLHGLTWQLAGQGDPVVLIHGAGLDSRMWDAEMVRLARDFAVVRYDLRGYGGSELAGPYSHVSDLEALLDELGLEHTHLIGLSMGGGVALQFALEHPERVRSLVLSAPAVPGWNRPPEASLPFRDAIQAALEGRDDVAVELWLDTPAVQLFSAGDEAREFLRTIIQDNPPGHQMRLPAPEPVPGPPAFERLEDVTAPTLLLIGEHDARDLHELTQILARRIPDARLVEIPRAGHLPNIDAPELFAKLVAEFLGGAAR